MATSYRYEFLDAIRGIAALSVVALHVTKTDSSASLFPYASFGVDIFFALSGFVIALSYANKINTGMTFKQFVVKRLIRLYPMFFMGAMIGCFALFFKVSYQQTSFTMDKLFLISILNFLYIPYFNSDVIHVFSDTITGHTFPINGPAWSLFFEFFINIVFFYTVALSKEKVLLLSLFCAVWLFLYNQFVFSNPPGWKTIAFLGGFPRVGYTFMVGVLLFKYIDFVKTLPKLNYLIISIVIIFLMNFPIFKSLGNHWLLTTLFIVPLIVSFGITAEIKNEYAKRFLLFLGDESYTVYCIHTPLFFIVSIFWVGQWRLRYGLIFIVAIYAISYFLTKYYELPTRKLLTQRFSK